MEKAVWLSFFLYLITCKNFADGLCATVADRPATPRASLAARLALSALHPHLEAVLSQTSKFDGEAGKMD